MHCDLMRLNAKLTQEDSVFSYNDVWLQLNNDLTMLLVVVDSGCPSLNSAINACDWSRCIGCLHSAN